MTTGRGSPENRCGTHQQRIGEGMSHSLRRAFRPDFKPDGAADDVLDSLINQIDGLPWPRSSDGETKQ